MLSCATWLICELLITKLNFDLRPPSSNGHLCWGPQAPASPCLPPPPWLGLLSSPWCSAAPATSSWAYTPVVFLAPLVLWPYLIFLSFTLMTHFSVLKLNVFSFVSSTYWSFLFSFWNVLALLLPSLKCPFWFRNLPVPISLNFPSFASKYCGQPREETWATGSSSNVNVFPINTSQRGYSPTFKPINHWAWNEFIDHS